jgi:hypothetical protein
MNSGMRHPSGLRVLVAGLVAAWGALTVTVDPWMAWADATCVPDTTGLNPAIWTTARGTFLGHALGQTFLAKDTLITKVTVWRPPNLPNVLGMHLFITAVDTIWSPPRPNAHQILLDGPTLHITDSNPPGQLVEVRFDLDPPLALPRPGYYAFFLQTEGCDAGEFMLVANEQNPYPFGIYWITGRAGQFTPCYLAGVAGGSDNTDLIFRIEFCRTTSTTPVRSSTWGRLKATYR